MNNRYTIAAVAAAAALALTACTDPADPKQENTPAGGQQTATTTPATPAASVTASRQSAAEEAAGLPPVPDADEATDYVTALRGIDSDIVTGASSEALINRGRDQCVTLYAVADKKVQTNTANIRFATVEHLSGFGDKAEQINNAVRKYICPKNWN